MEYAFFAKCKPDPIICKSDPPIIPDYDPLVNPDYDPLVNPDYDPLVNPDQDSLVNPDQELLIHLLILIRIRSLILIRIHSFILITLTYTKVVKLNKGRWSVGITILCNFLMPHIKSIFTLYLFVTTYWMYTILA